jgi:hypothetical protein
MSYICPLALRKQAPSLCSNIVIIDWGLLRVAAGDWRVCAFFYG